MPWDGIAKVGALILLDLLLLGGLIAIPLGLSGNFILLGLALIVAIVTKFQAISPWILGGMAVMVIIGEILEVLLASSMARRYGASKWGVIGAFVGGIVGAILGTPMCAVLFEWLHLRKLQPSMPAGWGAFLGKLLSSLLKICIGLAIAIYVVIVTH
jgi:uncharacterized protein YqgC (DUF456 family)